MKTPYYPTSPNSENSKIFEPSESFRNAVTSVVVSIVFFFLFYLLLILLAAVIMMGCGWLGITIITLKAGFLTLAAGAGVIALGIMFFIFMFKFIFARSKDENPFRIEIFEADHPELFSFIKALNKDTKTKFPKKIFISPDVNAMVFYNSSFWSLFLPVKKNLEIGLGLINCLTISELKAVLAHEFGHFSQRSMKLGSYIYTVNKVIYNLVYEYDSWDDTLAGWANTGGIFGFFAGITFWLVNQVRSLLKFAYNLMNINYMKLSREMEYHADLVAVSVSGNKSFKNALRKLEFASFAYDFTTDNLNKLSDKNKASTNIYTDHKHSLAFIAKNNNISFQGGSFEINDDDLNNSIVKSRINIKNQWASHPTLKEREDNISKVNIICEDVNQPAWNLFSNPESLQKRVTGTIYQIGFQDKSLEVMDELSFKLFIESEFNKFKISERYNGYYDERFLSQINLDLNNYTTQLTFNEIFNKENVDFIKRLESNKIDMEIIQQIQAKQIPVKFFEFDGKKYKRKEAEVVRKQLSEEIENETLKVNQLDQEAFNLFYQLAMQKKSEKQLLDLYQSYFQYAEALNNFNSLNHRFQELAGILYGQPRWTEEGFKQIMNELSSFESNFKLFLKSLDWDKLNLDLGSEKQEKVLTQYLNNDNVFIRSYNFEEQSFLNFSELIQNTGTALSNRFGHHLKELTDFQLSTLQQIDKDMERDPSGAA